MRSLLTPLLDALAEEETGDADGGEGLTQEMLDSLGERVGTVGRTGRGRHTTRHTTLLTLPNGGIVADTPGRQLPATCMRHGAPMGASVGTGR